MKRFPLFLLTASLALFTSCDTNSESGSDGLDNTFTIGFKEYHEDENSLPVFGINITTNESFGCINYSLVTSHKLKRNVLSISMDDISIGDLCLTAIGPASTFIPLNMDSGEYRLELTNGNSKELFELKITDDLVQINRIFRRGFNFPPYQFTTPYSEWYLYPENSFALVGGTNTNNTQLYENFLNSIRSNFPITKFQIPANSSTPYPSGGSGHWVDYPASYFTYPSEEVYVQIGEFLIEYSSQNIYSGSGVGFYTVNWKNVWYRSWMHDRD